MTCLHSFAYFIQLATPRPEKCQQDSNSDRTLTAWPPPRPTTHDWDGAKMFYNMCTMFELTYASLLTYLPWCTLLQFKLRQATYLRLKESCWNGKPSTREWEREKNSTENANLNWIMRCTNMKTFPHKLWKSIFHFHAWRIFVSFFPEILFKFLKVGRDKHLLPSPPIYPSLIASICIRKQAYNIVRHTPECMSHTPPVVCVKHA